MKAILSNGVELKNAGAELIYSPTAENDEQYILNIFFDKVGEIDEFKTQIENGLDVITINDDDGREIQKYENYSNVIRIMDQIQHDGITYRVLTLKK